MNASRIPRSSPPASLINFTSATTKRQRHSSSSSCSNLADSGYVLLRPVQPNRTLPPPKSARLHAPPTTTAPRTISSATPPTPAKAHVVSPTNAVSTSDAGATASSTAPSPTRAAQAASVSNSAEVDDEGFITVANKKSRPLAAKSEMFLPSLPDPLPPLILPRVPVTVTSPPSLSGSLPTIPNAAAGDFCYHLRCRRSLVVRQREPLLLPMRITSR